MPLYDYECSKCGSIKEVQHSISDIGIIKVWCDECGNLMKKKLSLPALIGFDDVGRSLTRKDREKASKENTATAKDDTSVAKDAKKERTASPEKNKDASK